MDPAIEIRKKCSVLTYVARIFAFLKAFYTIFSSSLFDKFIEFSKRFPPLVQSICPDWLGFQISSGYFTPFFHFCLLFSASMVVIPFRFQSSGLKCNQSQKERATIRLFLLSPRQVRFHSRVGVRVVADCMLPTGSRSQGMVPILFESSTYEREFSGRTPAHLSRGEYWLGKCCDGL